MKTVLLVYLIIAVTFYLNLIITDYFYLSLRPGISSRDRVKVDTNVKSITSLRKLSIFWPYVLYRILK